MWYRDDGFLYHKTSAEFSLTENQAERRKEIIWNLFRNFLRDAGCPEFTFVNINRQQWQKTENHMKMWFCRTRPGQSMPRSGIRIRWGLMILKHWIILKSWEMSPILQVHCSWTSSVQEKPVRESTIPPIIFRWANVISTRCTENWWRLSKPSKIHTCPVC